MYTTIYHHTPETDRISAIAAWMGHPTDTRYLKVARHLDHLFHSNNIDLYQNETALGISDNHMKKSCGQHMSSDGSKPSNWNHVRDHNGGVITRVQQGTAWGPNKGISQYRLSRLEALRQHLNWGTPMSDTTEILPGVDNVTRRVALDINVAGLKTAMRMGERDLALFKRIEKEEKGNPPYSKMYWEARANAWSTTEIQSAQAILKEARNGRLYMEFGPGQNPRDHRLYGRGQANLQTCSRRVRAAALDQVTIIDINAAVVSVMLMATGMLPGAARDYVANKDRWRKDITREVYGFHTPSVEDNIKRALTSLTFGAKTSHVHHTTSLYEILGGGKAEAFIARPQVKELEAWLDFMRGHMSPGGKPSDVYFQYTMYETALRAGLEQLVLEVMGREADVMPLHDGVIVNGKPTAQQRADIKIGFQRQVTTLAQYLLETGQLDSVFEQAQDIFTHDVRGAYINHCQSLVTISVDYHEDPHQKSMREAQRKRELAQNKPLIA